MGSSIEPTADQIEKRARELCREDGLDPDQPAPEGWDPAVQGAQWRGYAEQARQELQAENFYAGKPPDDEQV